ncbi:hypothetical protein H5410_022430 [Solanum commersonii]|uniref:Uncharacterized protein n=1 Tax=Solanum commersonii TaxID=4109 RepID=A0A9J5ZFE8_SOLCO|nr:hypothetical protein H5410_022430 [Solanum commersonii]
MAKLQMRIGGHPVTKEEIETLSECYLLKDGTMYMCRMGPTFQEPIDDDNATADEEEGSEEDHSDDVGPGDNDMDAGDGAGDAPSMAVDFFTNAKDTETFFWCTGSTTRQPAMRAGALP